MKLHPASRKEVIRIALGTLIGDAVMIAAFFLLSQLGIGIFDLSSILLGALGGSIIAILNFAVLCLTIQQAVEMEDQKIMKARFQLSYNIRMVIQAGWVVLCFFADPINIFAGAIPLLFPKATILILRTSGNFLPHPVGFSGTPEGIQTADED